MTIYHGHFRITIYCVFLPPIYVALMFAIAMWINIRSNCNRRLWLRASHATPHPRHLFCIRPSSPEKVALPTKTSEHLASAEHRLAYHLTRKRKAVVQFIFRDGGTSLLIIGLRPSFRSNTLFSNSYTHRESRLALIHLLHIHRFRQRGTIAQLPIASLAWLPRSPAQRSTSTILCTRSTLILKMRID